MKSNLKTIKSSLPTDAETSFRSKFASDETRAGTVDWVLLAAAMVSIAIATSNVVGDGATENADATATATESVADLTQRTAVW